MNTKFSPFSVIWFRRFLPFSFLGLLWELNQVRLFSLAANSRSAAIDSFSLHSRFLLLFAPSTALYSTFYAYQLPAHSRSLRLSPSPNIYHPSWWNPCCLGQLLPQQTPASTIRDRDHSESYAYPLVACRRIWKSASNRS